MVDKMWDLMQKSIAIIAEAESADPEHHRCVMNLNNCSSTSQSKEKFTEMCAYMRFSHMRATALGMKGLVDVRHPML